MNILIVGASSGIGKSLAGLLAQDGHAIYGTYHNRMVEDSSSIQYQQYDVLGNSSLQNLPEQLDALVYCPGSINLLPFHRIKEEAFVDDYRLQVVGAIKVIQEVLPRLKKSANASIVLFSTVAVQNGFNFHSQVAASKGAIEGLTRALSAEFAPTIRVNAIAPSLTDTPLAGRLLNSDEKKKANAERHPLKKLGEADDIAEAAYYLLSQRSKWMTGQILKVDGGMSVVRG